MRTLVWSPAFTRALKKMIRRNAELADKAEEILLLTVGTHDEVY